MKRLYYLCDNLDSTESVSNDMHKAGISDWHFHVMSRDEAGLYKRHIQSSTIYQDTDVIHSGERGALVGLSAGFAMLFYITQFSGLADHITGLFTVFFVGATTLFGAWFGGFIGFSKENYQVRRFHDAIEQGKYLIIIDVQVGQEAQVKAIMAKWHPDALEQGVGSSDIMPFEPGTPTR